MRLGRGHTLATQDFGTWCEERRATFEKTASAGTRDSLRALVRKQAKARGVAVPEWAARRQKMIGAEPGSSTHLPPTKQARARVGQAPAGARPPKPGKAWRHQLVPSKRAKVDAAPAQPVDLGVLSSWRAQGYGRAVSVHDGRVTLYPGVGEGTKPQVFASVAAACAAVAAV